MKKLALFLLAFSAACFGLSDHASCNIRKCWEQGTHEDCIDFLDKLIEDKATPNIDRLHYVVTRSILHLSAEDLFGYCEDISILKSLCEKDAECAAEAFSHYEYSSLYHCPK